MNAQSNDLQPGSSCSEIHPGLSELHFLVWLAQQKKEKRRLVIATLEALVGSSSSPNPSVLSSNSLRLNGRICRGVPARQR
jgi:hypothetical protein